MTGPRSYDNYIFQRSVDGPSIMKSTSSDLGTSLNRGLGHHSLWLSTIDIYGVNDLWVFSSILNANPAIIGFSIITTRSSCLCLIGVSWKSVARELTFSFLIFVTHIASFHLVINAMGKSAWVQHNQQQKICQKRVELFRHLIFSGFYANCNDYEKNDVSLRWK